MRNFSTSQKYIVDSNAFSINLARTCLRLAQLVQYNCHQSLVTLGQNQSYQLLLHRSPNCSISCEPNIVLVRVCALRLCITMDTQALAWHRLPNCRATSSRKIACSCLPAPQHASLRAQRHAVLRVLVSCNVAILPSAALRRCPVTC